MAHLCNNTVEYTFTNIISRRHQRLNKDTNLFLRKTIQFDDKAGTVAEWSRVLVQNYSEWMVPTSNPGEGCYGDGESSGSCIALFPHMAKSNLEPRMGGRALIPIWIQAPNQSPP